MKDKLGMSFIKILMIVVIPLMLVGIIIEILLITDVVKTEIAVEQNEQEQENNKLIENAIQNEVDNPQQDDEPEPELPQTEGTKPYFPSLEFAQIEGTDLTTGLVIEDSNKNQYVWIEVPNDGTGPDYSAVTSNTDYENIKNALKLYTTDYSSYGATGEDSWRADCGISSEEEYNQLYNTMLQSVYENGGFYIGRYETGVDIADSVSEVIPDTTNTVNNSSSRNKTKNNNIVEEKSYSVTITGSTNETPAIRANIYPYSNITCSQAQKLASKMSSGDYTSSLMFGLQWDLVLKYLETKGIENGKTLATMQSELRANSTDWGNYQNTIYSIQNQLAKYSLDNGVTWKYAPYAKTASGSILLTTGANENFYKMNIYDLAGNVWEWTLENSSHAYRGGGYSNFGFFSAAVRNEDQTSEIPEIPNINGIQGNTTTNEAKAGFRVTIF